MLCQGIVMCFYSSPQTTLVSLDSLQLTDSIIQCILSQVNALKQDFEIKRFVIGLS